MFKMAEHKVNTPHKTATLFDCLRYLVLSRIIIWMFLNEAEARIVSQRSSGFSVGDLIDDRFGRFSSDLDDVEIWCWTPEKGPDDHLTLSVGQSDAQERLVQHNFDATRPTKILVNGFNSRPTNHYQLYVRAYFSLTGRQVNILGINWRKLSRFNYISAASNAIKVGQSVGAYFARLLLQDMDVSPENIHIIGHSLGAHVAGHMGRTMEEVGGKGKVARITALDPAGPGFDETSMRVQIGDAKFLDVIHSNGGQLKMSQFSILEPIGNVDFYPNGGQRQPGCNTWRDVALSCSHKRAYLYYVESIAYVGQSGKFLARACDQYQAYQRNEPGCCDKFLNMGEGLTKEMYEQNASQYFFLTTNDSSPFSQ